MVGCLQQINHRSIHVRTDKQDYLNIPDHTYTWMQTVYSDIIEEIADNTSIPRGNLVLTTTYKDANPFHNFVTGRAVTGILYLLNQTGS